MTQTNHSSNTSNIFRRIRKRFGDIKSDKRTSSDRHFLIGSEHHNPQHQTPYYSPEITNVLFLSKRGLSRAPVAREIMRSLLHLSDLFGGVRPSARGISDAYEFCPFDKRMVLSAKKFGYEISGSSRRVNMSELSSANLLIPLDHPSNQYLLSRKYYIHGEIKPVEELLPSGHSPFISDPFERGENDANDNYDEIIRDLELACSNLLKLIPSIL